MKILRTAIIISLGAFALPSPPPGDPAAAGVPAQARQQADSAALALAAMRTASDAAGFCARQPDVCATAGAAWRIMQAKLKYSLRLAYEWAGGAPRQGAGSPAPTLPASAGEPAETATPEDIRSLLKGAAMQADPLITGSVFPVRQRIAANRDASQQETEGSENTLRIEDLAVPWNGPEEG